MQAQAESLYHLPRLNEESIQQIDLQFATLQGSAMKASPQRLLRFMT